jgi:hypothetical protein
MQARPNSSVYIRRSLALKTNFGADIYILISDYFRYR